jgi:hypothetical protein
MATEGVVAFKCELQPFDSPEYQNILKSRNEASNVKKKLISLSDGNGELLERNFLLSKRRKVEERKPNFSRSDKSEVEQKLFSLFTRRERYDFDTLKKETEQPGVQQFKLYSYLHVCSPG